MGINKNKKVLKLAVLAVAVIAAVLILVLSMERTKSGSGSNEKEMSDVTKAAAVMTERASMEEETIMAEEIIMTEDAITTEDAIMTGAAAVTEEMAMAEAEPQYLASLSGLAPGTVLDAEQFDFENLDLYFMSWKIEEGDNLYDRINGKSYRENDDVPLAALRYLKMPHYNFDGQIQVGEMIVNKEIEEDVKSIFKELFLIRYQIQSMYLIDNYWTGDPDTSDYASIDDNNTSAFCYRQITGGRKLSNHAYGRAVDLNPRQNPYVSYKDGLAKWAHSNADDYIVRGTGLNHVITHEDPAYEIFKKYGFQWGGDWNNPKDYQHFDKAK